jgi:hypothetical protein
MSNHGLSSADQAFVALFIAARKRFEAAELEYLAFLYDAEQTKRDKWGHLASSFEDFIKRYVGKPELSKYASYKEAVKELGLAKVRLIGLDASTEEVRLKGEARSKFDAAAVAWTAEQKGRHMSSETARVTRQKVAPVESVPGPVRRNEELEALRAENAELRREIARKEKQIQEMRSTWTPPRQNGKPKKDARGGPEARP